jgi:1-acyl-sn-glycerol-3-phosphate acyltransferase
VLLLLRYALVRSALRRHETLAKKDTWQSDLTYVVYANHQSSFDALLISAALPLAVLRCLLPLRFFTANRLLKGVTGSFLTSVGCFPANEHDDRPFGLDYASTLIEAGCSLVIFPTGRRTREQGKARRGVAVLAADPSVRLLPVYLNWRNRWSCELSIGAPFQASAGATADELMERVYRLSAGLTKE